jgi:hypothetical protein
MELAVILLNYNLADFTIACVRSIQASDFPSIRIILVDNGSAQDDYHRLQAALPELQVYRLEHNIQCAGGMNAGIQLALDTPATHIMVLNNDTIVEPAATRLLLEADCDIAVPKILYYDDPGVIWSAGGHWRRFPPMVTIRGYRKPDAPQFDRRIRLNYATSCAYLARRQVFEQIGLFDEDFGCYQEDWDFFYRANAAGLDIQYIPASRILHRVSLTLGKFPAHRRHNLARNMVHFYLKEHRFSRWQLNLYIAWVLLRETVKGNLAEIPDTWRGFQDGYRTWGG